ncbi:MAG: DUF4212 domain-containing protein [Phycisphaeraceae bacterium]
MAESPHDVDAPPQPAEQVRVPDPIGYWKANVRLIVSLLCVWAAVSFGCSIFFIEQLNAFSIGGLPLGFWFAQQGSMYVFVVLIAIYAWRMDRLDRKFGVGQEGDQ